MDIKKTLLRVTAVSAIALSLQVGCIKAIQNQDAPQKPAHQVAFKVPPPDMQRYFDTAYSHTPAFAPQPTSPIIKINGQETPYIYLQSLDISVDVTGNIATTRHTLVFRNGSGRYLSGFLVFPLPDGRSVTHYALDVDGQMREAVPMPKAVATRVFEEIDLQTLPLPIDTGIFERTEGNNFRTRIDLFPPYEARTITIGYEEELPVLEDGLFHYRLPLSYPSVLEKFAVGVTVWGGDKKPVVTESEAEEKIVFDKAGDHYVASFTRDNYKPPRALTFALPVPIDTPTVLVQPAQGGNYFLASVAPVMESRKKRYGDTLAIIWDVSLSGLQRDLRRELELLEIIFADKKDATVNLYFLNNRFKKVSADSGLSVVDGDLGGLKAALNSAIFDGGTDFSQINLSDIAGDEILFFSDGISTLSDAFFLKNSDLKRPIHCVVSSPKADYSAMRRLAGRTGGKFVDINAKSSEKLRSELLNETLQFLGVEHGKSISEVYPSIATPVFGNFSVAGICSAGNAELTLLFGTKGIASKKVSVKISASDTVSQGYGNVDKIWAQKKIAELDLDYKRNRAEITELGTRFGIVTRGTSLIVLKTLDDYFRYNVTPPKEFGTEILADTAAFFADTAGLAAERLAELWRAVSNEEEGVVWVRPGKILDTLNTAELSADLRRAIFEGEDEGAVWERVIKHQDALNRAKKWRDKEVWERKLKHLKELDRVRAQHKNALNRVAKSREVESGMFDYAVTSVAPQVKEWWDTDVTKVKEHRMVIAKEDRTEEKIKIYKNETRGADEEPFVRVWRCDPLTVTAVRKNHYKVETVLPTTVEHPIKNDERKPYYSTVEGFVRKRDVRKLSASEVAAHVKARSVSDYTSTRGIPPPIFWACGCDGDSRKPVSTATVAAWGEFTGTETGTGTAANGDNSRRCHGEGADLNILTGNAEADYRTYLKLREHHAASPTFYFDMAGWFYAHGDKETGLRILTSIAELEQESAPLYRMLGYRLKEYGEFAYLKFVYEKVMEWRPMDPQSYRDYALALFDFGYEQAALDSLYALLERPFPEINHVRYLGLAEVVIAEINRLITKNPYLKTSKIDERLIKSAPVDLRVVINWNKNDTDIDLHVVDPRGETYNHINRRVRRPWLGGRIGLDNEDGYGPEQFMLKKAASGKYRIYASYYDASPYMPEDPVTVMAEIFTKYGDKKAERRQVVCLHLAERTEWDWDDNGRVLLAEFEL